MEQAPQPVAVLGDQRVIESQLLVERLYRGGRGVGTSNAAAGFPGTTCNRKYEPTEIKNSTMTRWTRRKPEERKMRFTALSSVHGLRLCGSRREEIKGRL